MTTLQLLSDLHLEFYHPVDRDNFFRSLKPGATEILILAGDICSFALLEEVLTAFCGIYPEVVFVAGNHEYYKSSPAAVKGAMWDLSVKLRNLHWLDNESKTILGVRFFGGTLWFPKPDLKTLLAGRAYMSDFQVIRELEPWVYDQNFVFKGMLRHRTPGEVDVVVSHHMPSFECVSPRFRTGPSAILNAFFFDELSDLIQLVAPKVWVYGHTHDRSERTLHSTRLLTNPRGYPQERETRERGEYVPELRFEIP